MKNYSSNNLCKNYLRKNEQKNREWNTNRNQNQKLKPIGFQKQKPKPKPFIKIVLKPKTGTEIKRFSVLTGF